MIKKICKKCGKSFEASLENFHKSKKYSDGLHIDCKTCVNNKNKEYTEKRAEGRKENTDRNVTRCCTECGEYKPLLPEFFHRKKQNPEGFETKCKACRSASKKVYNARPEIKAKRTTEEYRRKNREYKNRPENKERIKEYEKAYKSSPARNTPEQKKKRSKKMKLWRKSEQGKKILQNYHKRKLAEDPYFHLRTQLSSRLSKTLAYINTNKPRSTFTYLGAPKEALLAHLDSGLYTMEHYQQNKRGDIKFHIDHIIPSKYFMEKLEVDDEGNITPETEPWLYKWWNYRNLRIWPAKENIEKSDKLDMDLIREYGIEDLL